MSSMIRYELKKVFIKPSNQASISLLLITLVVICFLAIRGDYYVDEQGRSEYGYHAIQKLKTEKKKWRGELTTEKLEGVLKADREVNQTDEYTSSNIQENNISFSRKQGFADIRGLINISFSKFREYDYFMIDSLSEEEIHHFYSNRIEHLNTWLRDETGDLFNEKEKNYLVSQYEKLKTPVTYDYADGWKQALLYLPTLIILTALIIGFLVSGIFSGEFQEKAESVWFASYYGRNKAIRSKIITGVLLATVVYWVTMLLYSGVLFALFGMDGANCVIQTDSSSWKSMYNITFFQEYQIALFGGYLGVILISIVTMCISSGTKSGVIAATMPFVLIFLPPILGNLSVFSDIQGLFPSELLSITSAVGTFALYQIGQDIIPSVPLLFIVYIPVCILLIPVLYRVTCKTEIV